MKKKNYLVIQMLLTALTLLTPSCQTVKGIEYIQEIPDISFPVFPVPDCVIFEFDTETVSMPLDYWQKIAEYKIDIDAVQKYLDKLRKESK